MRILLAFSLAAALIATPAAAENWGAQAEKHSVELQDFEFDTGETLPAITMAYYTLGTAKRSDEGKITNAVLLIHGTSGDGRAILAPSFGGELFGPGQPLDLAETYIISPDNLGHGDSSKPSDGLRRDFPRYDYDDMVRAQYRLLTEGIGLDSVEMVIGSSMGCMHAFVWGTNYPGFAKRLVPLACNATEIGGRNRMWRKMIVSGFEEDPDYDAGNYEDPADLETGHRIYANTATFVITNPYRLQAEAPTADAADQVLAGYQRALIGRAVDPNDTIYQFDASRTYNPAPHLSDIQVPVLWINSADDFMAPPGLGNPEALAAEMPNARFILIPASEDTLGHGTHLNASFWVDELVAFLAEHDD